VVLSFLIGMGLRPLALGLRRLIFGWGNAQMLSAALPTSAQRWRLACLADGWWRFGAGAVIHGHC
jgi:hypothetical protein